MVTNMCTGQKQSRALDMQTKIGQHLDRCDAPIHPILATNGASREKILVRITPALSSAAVAEMSWLNSLPCIYLTHAVVSLVLTLLARPLLLDDDDDDDERCKV